ncbi:hypothetical protein CYLTODRAFT_215242 [Cylindrobasidium torrendii FP15055 ss-10]|uniref:non-specific serine/threonine protein kinase n=1 Tax=Cylindrobasidium torrendii FP15055 ss-10 TaxID=1314674 RepID=A0A0D7BHT3_9AGAR|nr:hypothetical protein CYLTODRAFT_215242 [Cylindrobasidium torrendii FP15055 ss-10]
MLAYRTKQVNCYGKQNRRVVNNSTDKDGVFSPLLDLPKPVPMTSPVKAKMKPREPILHKPSPKAPVRKRIITKSIKPNTTLPNDIVIESLPTKPPLCTPLVTFNPNLPDLKITPPKPRKKPSPSSRRRQSGGLTKSFVPFVEVDISVLDDEGNTLTKEKRRISQGRQTLPTGNEDEDEEDVQPKPRKPRHIVRRKVPESDASDSELETRKAPRKPTRKPPVRCISSSSDSEDDAPPPPIKKPTRRIAPTNQKAAISDELSARAATPPSKRAPPIRTKRKPAGVRAGSPVGPEPAEQLSLPPAPSTPTFDTPTDISYAYLADANVPSRPRQLTPVRLGARRMFPCPPSPSSCGSSDLEEFESQMERLALDDDEQTNRPDYPEYLRPLLEECDQDEIGIHEFSSFISAFPYDPVLLSSGTSSSKLRFRKVGEASFSEVFGIGDVVLKIIPIRNESLDNFDSSALSAQEDDPDKPAPSDARDVLKEVIVTRAMGDVHKIFVKMLKAYVVKGRYPQDLLELWDDYNSEKGSENIRPDAFGLSQVYAILVLPNGGPDLESYNFKLPAKTGWRQASSIFWQVAKGLAHAEQLVSFEHRDLHLGQILVKDLPAASATALRAQVRNHDVASSKEWMDSSAHRVKVTIIDLGLSRMDAGDGSGGEMIHWTPFDDEVFEGEGDYQFAIYRMMRDQNLDEWETFRPLSNVMWLHYLVINLLKYKGLRAPRKNPTSQSGIAERECYECLTDLDQWLSACLSKATAKAKKSVNGKGRRKTTVVGPPSYDDSLSPLCAGEIVEYGVKRTWIRANRV